MESEQNGPQVTDSADAKAFNTNAYKRNQELPFNILLRHLQVNIFRNALSSIERL